ncbi:MAG: TolC family protein, partial [Gemmatimonadetes bacterium]|nr:TolC family protein [Gemmatimonadota bacterium]
GLGSDMMTMTKVQVGAQLPWPGKLSLREDVARFGAEAAGWELERARDRIRTEVKATYYQAYFVDRALEVTARNETLVSDFALLTSSKYAVGTGAQPDVLKAQVERSRLADQLIALREERTGLVARLNALLGRPTDTPLPSTELPEEVRAVALLSSTDELSFASATLSGVLPGSSDPSGPLQSVADLERQALEHNPTIQAHVRRVAAQERAVALAETAKLPDLSLTAAYSYRLGLGDFFEFMVSAPLPIFAGRKQDQAALEQAATLAEQQARYHAMVNDVNADIASLWADLQRARDQIVLLNEGILPQARTSLSSATASYQVGAVDFLTLLDSQVTLYRHELDYHRLLADFANNLAALERAVGTEVLR